MTELPQWMQYVRDRMVAIEEFKQFCLKLGVDADWWLERVEKIAMETPYSHSFALQKAREQIASRMPYTVIVSENMVRANFVCEDREYPINPRARTTIIVIRAADGMRKLRGHRFDESLGDRLIWESGPDRQYGADEINQLIRLLKDRGFDMGRFI